MLESELESEFMAVGEEGKGALVLVLVVFFWRCWWVEEVFPFAFASAFAWVFDLDLVRLLGWANQVEAWGRGGASSPGWRASCTVRLKFM